MRGLVASLYWKGRAGNTPHRVQSCPGQDVESKSSFTDVFSRSRWTISHRALRIRRGSRVSTTRSVWAEPVQCAAGPATAVRSATEPAVWPTPGLSAAGWLPAAKPAGPAGSRRSSPSCTDGSECFRQSWHQAMERPGRMGRRSLHPVLRNLQFLRMGQIGGQRVHPRHQHSLQGDH